MKDILRGQLRQAFRNKLIYIAFFLLLATLILVVLNATAEGDQSASYIIGEQGWVIFGFTVFFQCFAVGWLCAADLEDQTINYEMTSGRTRKDVFFGRVVPSVCIGTVGSMILVAVPALFIIKICGWGNALPFSNVLLRFGLLVFPLLRLGAFTAAIMFIVKKRLITVMIATFAAMFTAFPVEQIPIPALHDFFRNPLMLGALNFHQLTSFESWYVYGLSEMKMHYIFYPELEVSFLAGTIIVSLVMTAVYLLLGYHFFHTDDMH